MWGFCVLIIIKMLVVQFFKSCFVSFVTMTPFNASNIKTQLKTHVISYYKMNGRTILKKMWVQTILLLQKRLMKK